MNGYACVFVIIAVLQVISAQGPPPPPFLKDAPEKCRLPPRVENPHECCVSEPFFKKEDFIECGFEEPGQTPDRRPGPPPPDCSKQICILNKYNLLKDGENPDVEAIKKMLDLYVEKNPNFKDAVEKAKDCLKEDLPTPPHMCVASKITFCIGSTLFMVCPDENWDTSENCKAFKDHMTECKKYFPKH